MSDLGRAREAHLFPVRHHSPRTSAVLRAFLDEVRPSVVLVEAPEDAEKLVGALVDPDTTPPVAILGYRTDGVPASALWPFAAYSPEYVAMRWAVQHGARVHFIDVPVSRTLGVQGSLHGEGAPPGGRPGDDVEEEEIPPDEPVGDGGDEPAALPDVHDACARARGFRTFEEFWEASFEAPRHDAASFRAALLGYADLVRAVDRGVVHRARDAYMAGKIVEHLRAGVPPSSIVAVVGAAHAAALVAGEIDPALLALLPEPVQVETTLIPFSFPRLAEQLGYGAGNRAPQFYQRAHEAGCSYTRATLEVLIEFTEHLRLRGFMASLADTIEAYRLAVSLADLRGKAEPGLDEVREATVATLCRGDATHVDGFLWPSVIGLRVGRVAGKVAKNSLQDEFWREVRARRLPASDSVELLTLKLHNPVEVGTSVFLHRLRVAGVPYAGFKRTQALRAQKATAKQDAGSTDALTRTNEVWEVQWTPSTDVALVERIVFGDTIEEVAGRVLRDRLDEAGATGAAANVLIEAVVAASAPTVTAALDACERLAAADEDVPSLAAACRVFSQLVARGTSRDLLGRGAEALPRLCCAVFDRAVLRLPGAASCADDAVAGPKAALRALYEVAQAQPLVDRAAFFTAARGLVDSFAVHPGISGLAAGLLYLGQMLDEAEVAAIVGLRVSDMLDPGRAAAFLGGFFEVNATVLVKSRPVVAALDVFLGAIERDRFRDTLPVLRRAFSALGATERRYLLENVIAVRKIGEKARAAAAVLQEKDKEKVKAMSADLAKAMDDLDDLLSAPDDLDDADREALLRWRLALGPGAERVDPQLSLESLRSLAAQFDIDPTRVGDLDEALSFVYDDEKANLGGSRPYIPRWLASLREFFRHDVIALVQQDAVEKKGLTELLFQPETLPLLEKNVALAATLIAARGLVPDTAREAARQIVREVVEDVRRKLEPEVRTALLGAVRRDRTSPLRLARNIDWKRTIHRNLKGWDAARRRLLPERFYFWANQRRHHAWDMAILVDQSGSMGESVVYSSIMAAIFASLDVLRTRLLFFDTEVVDVTPLLVDPVDVLFAAQLGGGTDIHRAVAYAEERFIERPEKTILLLISDLEEGGDRASLLARMQKLCDSRVKVLCLLALSDAGKPVYDHDLAARLGKMGVPCFGCTPALLPRVIERVMKGQDLRPLLAGG